MLIQTWTIKGDGFHFGEHGMGQETTAVTFPSDSLFAALIFKLSELEGHSAVEAFVRPLLEGSPPFLLTSTFPFAGGVRFFPLPLSALRVSEERLHSSPQEGKDISIPGLKQLKKVSYLSEGLFRQLLQGVPLIQLYVSAHKLQGDSLLVSPQELSLLPEALQREDARLWAVEQRPRVTLGRGVQNASIYFTGRVSFLTECGLWFGLRWLEQDTSLGRTLEMLLSELSEAGLGAERSSGFGKCRIEPAPQLELPEALNGAWVTLSRYLPQPEEISALEAAEAAYSLKRVGGWLVSSTGRGQRRRFVNLLVEGSVFGPLSRKAPGQVLDVRPRYAKDADPLGHAVYRYGLAFPVSVSGVPT